VICICIVATVFLDHAQHGTAVRSNSSPHISSPAVPSAPRPVIGEQASDQRPLSSKERQRKTFAELLNALYKREGRLIRVTCVGDEYERLQLNSGLIFEGSNTLAAARRETTDCAECMSIMSQLGFTEILISGEVYKEEISLRRLGK
jgi:hypothetical protein